jgi:hypothetical protein
MKNLFYTIIAIFILNSCGSTNKIKEVVIEYDDNITNYTPIVNEVLLNNKKGNIKLIFEDAVYKFFPEASYHRYVKISNNDNGIKKVAFPILQGSNIIIEGNNTVFLMHGELIPFLIEGVHNIAISGIDIDYDKPFTFEGLVVANNREAGWFDLKVSAENEYKIVNNELFFRGYDWELGLGENIVFNPNTKRPYYYASKYEHNYHAGHLIAKELKPGLIRFSGIHAQEVPPVGSIWVDKGPHGSNRLTPGFRLYNSQNISIKNVNVFAAGAMALIAEKCINVYLNAFDVKLADNSSRMISASADATHFINCKGEIRLENCSFKNMLDDATNVHGTYMVVSNIINDYTVELKFKHFQQEGFDFANPYDTVRFIDRNTLFPILKTVVKDIKHINEATYQLTVQDNINGIINLHSAVENVSWMPSFVMRNCEVKQNRARSILISTSKNVVVDSNYFSSMMAGIRICGDANYWFESGPVSNVLIKNNTFEEIGIGGHNPQAILQIDPVIKKEFLKEGYYHKNIVFENNLIKTFDPQIIYAISVDGLIIRNNKIIQTIAHAQIFADLCQFDIQDCKNVQILNNIYIGDSDALISIKDVKAPIYNNQKGFASKIVEKPNKYFYEN